MFNLTNGTATDGEPSRKQMVYSKGIFHGLPSLTHAPNGLTAIVTGANGISGAHMIRVLASSPSRWTKIYALSRRPPSGDWPQNVEHIPLDFLKSPTEIAEVLKERGVRADYIYFFSYILVTAPGTGALDWGDSRLVEQNNLILTNFLEALPKADALPKRFFIQHGGKWYGVHLGASIVPMTEDLPPLKGYEDKNLYYTQQSLLESFCHQHNISWNSGRPPYVIGATLDSTQTLLYPILAYACVQKSLGRGLEFPSDLAAWWAPNSMGNATLDSYMFEWAVLTEGTANQAFNASDDSIFTWGRFWPALAQRFSIPWSGPNTDPTTVWKERPMPADPPPQGLGSRTVRRFKSSFTDWAREPENQEAWRRLAEQHGLREGAGEWKDVGAIFGRFDLAVCGPDAKIMSSAKAKKFGWFGGCDSVESMFAVMDEIVKLRLVPDPDKIRV